MEPIRMSHSAINQGEQCPRKALFSRKLRLYPEIGSTAIRYGSGYHRGMEGYYSNDRNIVKAIEAAANYWKKPTIQKFLPDYRTLDNLLTSLGQYNDRYAADNVKVIGMPENTLTMEITLTKSEKTVYGAFSINFVVVIDLMLEIDGMIWVVDFKTTSVDLPYIVSKLRRLSQLMGYQFVAQDKIPEVTGTFCYYHQLKASKSKKTGEYGELTIDFLNSPQIFGSHDFNQWRQYVIWSTHKLLVAEKAGWPPEYASCYNFNRACEYLPLCDYPKWDIDRFMTMPGFVIVPDDREEMVADD
jgi:hypothetical protein